MTTSSVQIIGGEELARKFKQMSDEMQGQVVEDALVSGGLVIVNDAKIKAPYITGTLRRSIHIGGHTDLTPGFKEDEGYSDIGVADEKNTILIGTNLVYAAIQEYGGRAGRNHTSVIPPHPYLRPAFDNNVDKVKEKISKVLKAQIERFAK